MLTHPCSCHANTKHCKTRKVTWLPKKVPTTNLTWPRSSGPSGPFHPHPGTRLGPAREGGARLARTLTGPPEPSPCSRPHWHRAATAVLRRKHSPTFCGHGRAGTLHGRKVPRHVHGGARTNRPQRCRHPQRTIYVIILI